MSWEAVKLGDIVEFSNGINFDKSAYSNGVKLIGVSNFGNRFSPDYDSLEEIKNEVVRSNDYLRDGDIVFVRSNGNKELVGRCMLIKNPESPVTYSGFCIRARLNDTKKYNPVFFTYLFKSSDFRKAITGSAVGANIQNLSQGRLSACEVRIPNYDFQIRIASILSAYDDLIENNQKQIKLLEEASQRLYKEWFVDLRFPGYETTPIIDGIPQGWRKVTLGDVAPILTGKKDANFGTEDGIYPFFTCSQEPIKAPSYSFDTSAVILAGNGDFNVKLYRGRFEAYQRTYVLSPHDDKYLYLLYNAVNESMAVLVKGASGSTIKFLTKGMIESIPLFIPTDDLLTQYNSYSEAVQQKLESLKKAIKNAAEARDRLLPKLMSGESEV